ncbi:hypothetical protein F511_05898 [Dorcoceras hygrometricum]|uniref:Uncharacterized protein n=1 Tax=Dorcoceras hygrometricum TaxID=472368 RepID=A0A2Z7CVW8_9LAMI|nr:hypothetical protein F511_05898 [Dorcoceras hygrometricum]
MASIKPATRYSNSLNSSTKSDPSSSAEFPSTRETSRALSNKNNGAGPQFNITSMVKKLVESKKTRSFSRDTKFVVAADCLADDLKRNAKRDTGLSGLHKKLFKGSSAGPKRGEESSRKALTEVKENTRTLAMDQALTTRPKAIAFSQGATLFLYNVAAQSAPIIPHGQPDQAAQRQQLDVRELPTWSPIPVEKLKDLCLKQREEIKYLKNAILFPDVNNSQLQDLLEKQGTELKQAKQLIPNLQRQITSLTGQLQYLAEDLAEVKANKYSLQGLSDDHFSSPRTPSYDQEDTANYLFDQEFSSGDYTTPRSVDDMFLKNINPCLTPCYSKTKSKDSGFSCSPERTFSKHNVHMPHQIGFVTCATKLSKSSESSNHPSGKGLIRTARRSEESKSINGKQMDRKLS